MIDATKTLEKLSSRASSAIARLDHDTPELEHHRAEATQAIITMRHVLRTCRVPRKAEWYAIVRDHETALGGDHD